MLKKGIDVLNETHLYSLIIKLSLQSHGKSWREALDFERKVRYCNITWILLEIQIEESSFTTLQISACKKILLLMDWKLHQHLSKLDLNWFPIEDFTIAKSNIYEFIKTFDVDNQRIRKSNSIKWEISANCSIKHICIKCRE